MTSDFKPVIAVAFPSSAERLGAAAVYRHFEDGGNLLYVGCSWSRGSASSVTRANLRPG